VSGGRAGGAPVKRRAGGAPVKPVKQSGLRRFAASAAAPATEAQPERAQPETAQPETAQGARRGPEETCEFCAAPVTADHGHVADLDASTLMCACRACYLLFTHPGASGRAQPNGEPPAGQVRSGVRGRYHSIPDRYLSDPQRPLSVAEWDALEIPVGLAFFLRSSRDGATTAFYPSPAGATECRLDLEAWSRIGADHPLLAAAEPDVEAVLISRGQGDVEAFLVPIDACYELAGRMRLLWHGFDGGAEARQSIADFLERVRARSRDLRPES
jgi:uncharacterized protein DUF5947